MCLALANLARNATAQEVIPLWTDGPPDETRVEGPETGTVCLSNISEPTLTVYRPDAMSATDMAVLVIPGGGYRIVCAGRTGHPVAEWLASQGITAAVLKYRLPDGRLEIPMQDAQQALRIMRYRAPEWNVAPDRIGAMGFSAGGHLAAMLALVPEQDFSSGRGDHLELSPRPDFLALIYPLTTMLDPYTHEPSRGRFLGPDADTELQARYSAHRLVTNESPPTFLVHAVNDSSAFMENSLLLFEALIEQGVQAELHLFEKGGHGFGISESSPAKAWRDLAIGWIRRLGDD